MLKALSAGMTQLPDIIDCSWTQFVLSTGQSCFTCLALGSCCELPKEISVMRI